MFDGQRILGMVR